MGRLQASANGEALQRALSWRGAAVYLLSQRRRVEWMNAYAAQRARSLRGPFFIDAKTLCGASSAVNTALRHALVRVNASPGEVRFDARDREGMHFPVTALSGRAAGLTYADENFSVVICGASTISRDVVSSLRAAFGLTQAEADIALGLADGLSVSEIADCRGISGVTIRSQLKRVYEKTGARRQSELAVMVWRWAALSAPAPGEAAPAPVGLSA